MIISVEAIGPVIKVKTSERKYNRRTVFGLWNNNIKKEFIFIGK